VSKAGGQWKHVDGGSAFVIPVSLLQHSNFVRLGPHAVKLVLDLGRQYTGFNNGYLCAAWNLMRKVGWRSRETLDLAVAETLHYNIIVKTQQGGRNKPNLYALTWWPIHAKDTGLPLDVPATQKPSDAWKEKRPDFELPAWLRRKRRSSKVLHAMRVTPSRTNTHSVQGHTHSV
jgi:hypothetical protein